MFGPPGHDLRIGPFAGSIQCMPDLGGPQTTVKARGAQGKSSQIHPDRRAWTPLTATSIIAGEPAMRFFGNNIATGV